jgi:F0F1-type ATP synthase delta subunit
MARATRQEISQAVLAMLQSGESTDAVASSLAGYLVSERRTRELDTLMRDIEGIRYASDDVLEATVVSARELNSSINQTIKDLLQAKQVHLHHRLSPSVVGGVRVHALDRQLDLTIEAKLKRLKNITGSIERN